MRVQTDICYLCGDEATTRDHIPPKGIFPRPLPNNLVTVPACAQCNNEAAGDDEYFRTTMSMLGYPGTVAARVWTERVVGSQFLRRPALRNALSSSLSLVEVRSPEGLYLGQAHQVKVLAKRVNSVVERILRGLYSHHYPETSLHSGVVVEINMIRPTATVADITSGLIHAEIGSGVAHQLHGTT